MTIILIAYGAFAVYSLPKESSPAIKFGIISITTVDVGVNPQDMDSLVTQKIEQEIKGLDGIKKITSNSALGVSTVTVELTNDAVVSDFLVKVRDKVDKVDLPTEADKPLIQELSTDNTNMFTLLLTAPADTYSLEYLKDRANDIKKELNGKDPIAIIDING